MHDLILPAIPFFVLFLVLEWLSFRHAGELDEDLIGYDTQDTRTSLEMGLGSVVIGFFWGFIVLAVYAALYELTPLRVPTDQPWAYVALFLADDLAFYWYHRISHEVRVFWASHIAHHSSTHFNLSTALRQPWVPLTTLPFWASLALLGFPPWMIFGMQSVSLIYQFGLHTERIRRLPAPVEYVFNTPSHHRVHHGSQERYLDKNYGGILIIWDRLFGTFADERERVVYGLTTNIDSYNPLVVAFGEYVHIWHDIRATRSWRERMGYVFGGPGWTPQHRGRGLAHDVAHELAHDADPVRS